MHARIFTASSSPLTLPHEGDDQHVRAAASPRYQVMVNSVALSAGGEWSLWARRWSLAGSEIGRSAPQYHLVLGS